MLTTEQNDRTCATNAVEFQPKVEISGAKRPAPALAIVIPCYNEEEVLDRSVDAIGGYLASLKQRGVVGQESYIYLVDDGSRDKTWDIIERLSAASPMIRGIKLARNFGHQGAVLAGMMEVDADAIITIDADMQDDETCIERMLQAYGRGAELVYGVRNDRTADSFGKRVTAESYYHILRFLGVPVVFNHADYRLMSRRAMRLLREFDETNLFLRGIMPLVGLKSETVEYARRERAAGVSKYPMTKMLALAWQGITSFSVVPLRIATVLGFVLATLSTGFGVWALVVRYLGDGAVPGWASTVIPMYFLGGIQLLFLGVIGEYIGKIYLETKRRPRYLIDVKTWD